MPQGVEHASTSYGVNDALAAKGSVMPKGVEHVTGEGGDIILVERKDQ